MGTTRVMHFSYAGLVSDEEFAVVSDDGTALELSNGFRFDLATGRCLNDETLLGASRYLDPDPVLAEAAAREGERRFLAAYPTAESYYDAMCDEAVDNEESCPSWEDAEAWWSARSGLH